MDLGRVAHIICFLLIKLTHNFALDFPKAFIEDNHYSKLYDTGVYE